VFSSDLSDKNADLKILARMLSFAGHRDALSRFTAANFTTVPEPSSLALVASSGGAAVLARRARRKPRPQSRIVAR
jgi:hypothetical protein